MHRQLNVYFENILWKYQCGSRKSCYSAGETLDKGDMSATLLADCLPYDVLIAKLHAYGIEWLSRRLLYSYVIQQQKRDSDWTIVTARGQKFCLGFHKDLLLGPYFSIYSYAIYFCLYLVDIARYADDNTSYCKGESIK